MAKGLSKEELLRVVADMAAPVAASFGLEIWGVELAGSGRPVARIFVDSPIGSPIDSPAIRPCPAAPEADILDASAAPGLPAPPDSTDAFLPPATDGTGVSVDQCAEISRMVGLAMEVEEVFSDAWVLEVSSPGMDRPFFRLAQLAPYVGQEVDVTLWDPHPDTPGRRKFRGPLLSVGDNEFSVRTEGEGGTTLDMMLPWPAVRKARLIPVFPDTSKPGQSKAPRSSRNAEEARAKGGGKNA